MKIPCLQPRRGEAGQTCLAFKDMYSGVWRRTFNVTCCCSSLCSVWRCIVIQWLACFDCYSMITQC